MAQQYEIVVGMEVHAELCTKTKIFCGCKNAFGAPPNTLCCPVCMGLPGALPVLNRQVVDDAVLMGHALHCRINRDSHMDRKNYFYPDLPKAYQITQWERPLCEEGYLDILVGGVKKRIGITRLHIEEDAGKLTYHPQTDGILVDFNRCGVPLIEIVSKPDMRSAEEAKAYLEGLVNVLRYLGISDARMQEGSVRADVNVSVRPMGETGFGERIELKNINSFGAVLRAVRSEAARQIALLETGGKVQQQTRRWDDAAGHSQLMRTKEDTPDYRYFRDPDIPSFTLSETYIQHIKDLVPELPLEKTVRYWQTYDLSLADAQQLAADKDRAAFFDAAVALRPAAAQLLANWLLGDVARYLNERQLALQDSALTPDVLCELVQLVEEGAISGTAAKTVLAALMQEKSSARAVVAQLGLAKIGDSDTLRGIVDAVLAAQPAAAADYRKGKNNALEFLIGQCMRVSRGKADATALRQIIQDTLGGQ